VTVLAHMAVGAAAGSLVGGRGAAFGLGLASHVVLDLIPHYEFTKIWLEACAIALLFGAMLALGLGATPVFWGALGGVLPDVENFLWRMGLIRGRDKCFPGHNERLSRWLPHGRSLGVRHAWWQVAIAAAAVLVVLWGTSRIRSA